MPYFEHKNYRLFYREQGQGPLLLILPGNTASSAHHAADLAYFGGRFHAVSMDFRGTGQSDRWSVWPADWWSQAAWDTAALVEHLGYKRATVLGTSGGGIVALLMAILAPERVQAVIADSCVARIPPERLQLVVATREQRTPVQVAFWQQGHGPDWAAVIEADNELFLQLAERGGDWFEGRLSKIHCPVLFTASLADEALPAVGEQVCDMMQQVPGSQASLTSEGAHPMMWSRADVFRRVVDSFLDDLVKRDQE